MKFTYQESAFWGALTKISPLLLIISMLLSFTSMFIFQVNYYEELMAENLPTMGVVLAWAIAIVTQFARMAFGIAGARDFYLGNSFSGSLGLAASLGISIFENFEAAWMAAHWENMEMLGLLRFIVWLGFVLEVRLILTAGNANDDDQPSETKSSTSGKKRFGNTRHSNQVENSLI